MGNGIFLDKDLKPSTKEIRDELGPSQTLWERLTGFIADNYQISGDFSFGGKKYGWHVWYRKSRKSLIALYPQHGYFVAQIVLGKEQALKAEHLKLGQNIRQVLEDAPQLHDGRWLFISARFTVKKTQRT